MYKCVNIHATFFFSVYLIFFHKLIFYYVLVPVDGKLFLEIWLLLFCDHEFKKCFELVLEILMLNM